MPEHAHGECPVCKRHLRLTKNGKIWQHGDKSNRNIWPPKNCPGVGQIPASKEQA